MRILQGKQAVVRSLIFISILLAALVSIQCSKPYVKKIPLSKKMQSVFLWQITIPDSLDTSSMSPEMAEYYSSFGRESGDYLDFGLNRGEDYSAQKLEYVESIRKALRDEGVNFIEPGLADGKIVVAVNAYKKFNYWESRKEGSTPGPIPGGYAYGYPSNTPSQKDPFYDYGDSVKVRQKYDDKLRIDNVVVELIGPDNRSMGVVIIKWDKLTPEVVAEKVAEFIREPDADRN